MILTSHALAGAVIGKNIETAWIIIPISIGLHFVFDSFRHGEYYDRQVDTVRSAFWRVIFDGLSGLLIIFLIGQLRHWDQTTFFYVYLGALASMFPDGITLLYWTTKWKFLEKIYNFHQFCHRLKRWPKASPERMWTIRNEINDIVFSLIGVLLLIFL